MNNISIMHILYRWRKRFRFFLLLLFTSCIPFLHNCANVHIVLRHPYRIFQSNYPSHLFWVGSLLAHSRPLSVIQSTAVDPVGSVSISVVGPRSMHTQRSSFAVAAARGRVSIFVIKRPPTVSSHIHRYTCLWSQQG